MMRELRPRNRAGFKARALQSPRGSEQRRSGNALLFSKLGGSFSYIRCVCSGREELPE